MKGILFNTMVRRKFIKQGALVSGTLLTISGMSIPVWSSVKKADLTIQQVIDKIVQNIPGGKLDTTVDTVKSGSPDDVCTGIVTTFLATVSVIRKTAELGANLIITHEPTFYNHLDEKEWMGDDKVLRAKEQLLTEHGIVVWRFHDYWHREDPDGVLEGIAKQIGWEKNWVDKDDNLFVIDQTSLSGLRDQLASGFRSDRCFYIGNPDQTVTNVAILPGAYGRFGQLEALQREDVEVLVVGELPEWEISEYVRDAADLGMDKGLVVVGHQPSEEPGMANAVGWLKSLFPDITVNHVSSTDAFRR